MADVLGLPIPDGYEIIFLLTLTIILVKLILGIYLAVKVNRSKKEENPVAPVFIGAVMLLMFLWAISRTLFSIFDFFLTKYDTNLYAEYVWWWKCGSLLAAVGVIAILFIIDKKILSNKFKGIFAYIMLAGTVLQFIYPVYAFDPDFIMASTIGIIGSATSFLVPILFLYIGKKTPGLRKTAFTFAFGIIIYVVGSAFVSASIITIFYSAGLDTNQVYFISTSMKVLGLLMVTYGTTRFRF
ncbi:MAG: hypothetical protein Q6373_001080 [Candidatus Sigynarchaeota archaeon]